MTWRRGGRERSLTPTALALHAACLGAGESASTFLPPDAVKEFRAHWPRVEVQVTIGLCDDLRRRVHSGELDAAITEQSDAGILGWKRGGSWALRQGPLVGELPT